MSTAATPQISVEFAMGYRAMVLEGLKNEFQTTKRVISAIPEPAKNWKPDPKSKTALELAWHIVYEDVIFLKNIARGEFGDFMAQAEHGKQIMPKTVADVVAYYDKEMPAAMAEVQSMTPNQLLKVVNFAGMFNFPAVIYLSFMNNHSIHHRGQLSTYLRPMGSKVPSIYGGSADEPMAM